MTYRRRHRLSDAEKLGVGAAVVLLLAGAGHSASSGVRPVPAPANAASAIAYARAQLGSPYVWGGTGPYGAGFDCSGLVMRAWQSAGVSLPRTSQEQWAAGHQVSTPAPGDLVFFAGADGTRSSPGHVGLVVHPATDTMIDAYAGGTPVRYDTYGPDASAPGLSDPVGFTDPAAGG